MPLDLRKIEAVLGRDVRRYLVEPEPEGWRALSADLEYLLTGHWKSDSLATDRWFDGVVEAKITASPPDQLDILGLMIWGVRGNDSRQWVDVFAAELRLVPGRGELASSILRFGRKGQEERRILFGDRASLRQDLEQPRTWDWAFVFRKPEGHA
jgi:hypothetical protein